MVAGQHLPCDAGQAIDVVARVGLAVLDHFRAGVGRREAAQAAGVEHCRLGIVFRLVEGARDAEIDDLDFALVGQEYVAGLQVAMHETLLVRITERAAYAADDAQHLGKRQAVKAGRAQHLAQRPAHQVFHRQVHHRTVTVEVVDGHDIRVRQRLRLLRFPLQGDERLRMAAELDIEHLDRNVGLAVRGLQLAQVQRLVDRAHAAEAYAFLQNEAAIERITDPFHALGVVVRWLMRAARVRPALRSHGGHRTQAGFAVFGAALLARQRWVFDPALQFLVDIGRQQSACVFLAEYFFQPLPVAALGGERAVDLGKELIA